jgi:hypothetical protein
MVLQKEQGRGCVGRLLLLLGAQPRLLRWRRRVPRCRRATMRQLMAASVLVGGLRLEEALLAHAFTAPFAQARHTPKPTPSPMQHSGPGPWG